MTDKPRRCAIWTTVAVTATPPGWRNAYRLDDGSVLLTSCPAMLLQEHRGTGDTDGRIEAKEPPYDTRVVFGDPDVPELIPAGDTMNYLGTFGPDDKLPVGETP